MPIAATPEPPYFAVVFTSERTTVEGDAYAEMSDALERIAPDQPGFLGLESVRDASGLGITVSYWRDEAAIRAWKTHATHRAAQRAGRERWYLDFALRIARVERAYYK